MPIEMGVQPDTNPKIYHTFSRIHGARIAREGGRGWGGGGVGGVGAGAHGARGARAHGPEARAYARLELNHGTRGGLPFFSTPIPPIPTVPTVPTVAPIPTVHRTSRRCPAGDLERDYNNFQLEQSVFSQGPGNFRDVNQNRRCDVLQVRVRP